MVAQFNTPEGTYGYAGEWSTGSLIPTNNILNINTTAGLPADRGRLVFDQDFGPGSNGGLRYEIGTAGGPVATFNTITFVADNGTGTSYSYGSGTVTGTGITWLNSSAQNNFWSTLQPNGATIQIFINNTNPNTGSPYFSDPCCCQFKHGGRPAPQMGYRVYLNRKSKGAYRPAGGKQCKTLAGCTNAKTVWKQGSNLDASVVTTNRRDNILACNSDVYTAKRDTCTGCVNDPTTNTMTVRDGSGVSNELLIGYNGPTGVAFGTYTPDNIVTSNGTLALELAEFSAWTQAPPATPTGISFGDLFVIFVDPSNNSGAQFTVAFVDCDDGSFQIFNTKDALYKDNTTAGLGGASANQYTAFIWGNTAAYGGTAVDISGIATAQAYAINSAGAYVPWDSMQVWWESKLTKSLKVIAVPNEGGIHAY